MWHSNKPASEQSSTPRRAEEGAAPQGEDARIARQAGGEAARRSSRASARDTGRIPGARRAALPAFVKPSLATLAANAPSSADWVHEIKFDGYRIQARIDGGKVTLRTRTGLDWTEKFPTVAAAAAALGRHDAILDGEIVSGDARRRVGFFRAAGRPQGRPA